MMDSKRNFLIALLFLFIIATAYAQYTSVPNPGHSALEVSVLDNTGTETDLQTALDQAYLLPTPTPSQGLEFVTAGLKPSGLQNEQNLGQGWDVTILRGDFTSTDGCSTGGFIYNTGTEIRASLHACGQESNFALTNTPQGPSTKIQAKIDSNNDIILIGSETISYLVLQ